MFRNWLSLTGLVVVVGSLFSFFLLLLLDALAHFSNPYVGILTYLVAPAFLVIGLVPGPAGRLPAPSPDRQDLRPAAAAAD